MPSKGTPVSLSADLSAETLQARGSGMIYLIDAEKAVDIVQHPFMMKRLQKIVSEETHHQYNKSHIW